MTVDPYDPPTAQVLSVVAGCWAQELLRDYGDDVPPHVDEFDVGYQAVDTWRGGNPDPALAVIRQALLDVGAITRLRSSSIGAIERRRVRWAVQHGTELPKPLSENRVWEVTDVDRFEETVTSFNRYFRPLPADVRDASSRGRPVLGRTSAHLNLAGSSTISSPGNAAAWRVSSSAPRRVPIPPLVQRHLQGHAHRLRRATLALAQRRRGAAEADADRTRTPRPRRRRHRRLGPGSARRRAPGSHYSEAVNAADRRTPRYGSQKLVAL